MSAEYRYLVLYFFKFITYYLFITYICLPFLSSMTLSIYSVFIPLTMCFNTCLLVSLKMFPEFICSSVIPCLPEFHMSCAFCFNTWSLSFIKYIKSPCKILTCCWDIVDIRQGGRCSSWLITD